MRTNLILALLAAVLAVPVWTTKRAEQVPELITTDLPLLFPGFSADLVGVIQIVRKKPKEEIEQKQLQGPAQFDQLVFVRTDSGWVMQNHPEMNPQGPDFAIDPDKVERDILDHVGALRVDQQTLVPADKVTEEWKAEQQLTEETGTMIGCMRGLNGPIVAKLVLGKSTKKDDKGSIHGYYVTRPDRGKEVVLYEPRNQYWDVSLRPTDWAKKKIHQFLMSEVATFHLKNEFGEAAFRKKAGSEQTWEAIPEHCPKDVGPVRQQEVSNLVNSFTTVNAESFHRGKIATDQSADSITVRATVKAGDEFVIWIGRQLRDKPETLVVSNVHNFQFGMADFHVNQFRDVKPYSLFDPQK